MDMIQLVGLVIIALYCISAVRIVPQQEVWLIERLGKFHAKLDGGLHFIIPIIDRIAYKHTLKERAIDVLEQEAITKDNVTVVIDGVIYVRIVNPSDASYGIENPYYAVSQLAQTSMRSAIGKITLDKTFEERETLNMQIVNIINEAATTWGIQCMRYEIRDIKPPASVLKAMELQVAAERQKRASVLESEGAQQATVNLAQAEKEKLVLNSEGYMTDQINRAKGQAEAIQLVAEATAKGIDIVARSIQQSGGVEAVSLRVAEQYVESFGNLAKTSNTLIIPSNANDVSGMITQALTIFQTVSSQAKVNK